MHCILATAAAAVLGIIRLSSSLIQLKLVPCRSCATFTFHGTATTSRLLPTHMPGGASATGPPATVITCSARCSGGPGGSGSRWTNHQRHQQWVWVGRAAGIHCGAGPPGCAWSSEASSCQGGRAGQRVEGLQCHCAIHARWVGGWREGGAPADAGHLTAD
jgi:hypothetical protein